MSTWSEKLAVVEAPTTHRRATTRIWKRKAKKPTSPPVYYNKHKKRNSQNDDGQNLCLRSYFQNELTGERFWDEPPSGAMHVRYISKEERRTAEQHLFEVKQASNPTSYLHVDFGAISSSGDGDHLEQEEEENLSMALAMSQSEATAAERNHTVSRMESSLSSSRNHAEEEEEEQGLAVAMALSMSETEDRNSNSFEAREVASTSIEEEKEMRIALELSLIDEKEHRNCDELNEEVKEEEECGDGSVMAPLAGSDSSESSLPPPEVPKTAEVSVRSLKNIKRTISGRLHDNQSRKDMSDLANLAGLV